MSRVTLQGLPEVMHSLQREWCVTPTPQRQLAFVASPTFSAVQLALGALAVLGGQVSPFFPGSSVLPDGVGTAVEVVSRLKASHVAYVSEGGVVKKALVKSCVPCDAPVVSLEDVLIGSHTWVDAVAALRGVLRWNTAASSHDCFARLVADMLRLSALRVAVHVMRDAGGVEAAVKGGLLWLLTAMASPDGSLNPDSCDNEDLLHQNVRPRAGSLL